MNYLQIRRLDAKGKELSSEIREIYYAGAPYRAKFAPEFSHLIADGRNPAIVAVRLTDSAGYPVRAGTSGQFSVKEPFTGWIPENQRLQTNLLSEAENTSRYLVRENGIAYFPIEATTQTGRVAIQVPLTEGRSETIEAWLSADARDWIMVGLAEGAWGRSQIEKEMLPSVEEDSYEQDGRVAFFGKGRVRGDFLLTMAYDSAKQNSKNPDELFDLIDPDEYYSVYGDESQVLNESQSSSKLYLKIERQQLYALFGDFQTDMSITELSSYSRSLNGFKSEFKNDYFETNLFASETSLANIRDEIPGNGTSGRYFLSRKNIVDFTEKVRIEIRDRFQTGEIISETTLNRNRDYEIDYDLGSLLFKNPVNTRDPLLNPIFIVVSYETQDDREAALVAGGRVEISDARDRAEFGLSHITEQNRGAETELTGVDFSYEVTKTLEIKSEIAVSDNISVGSAQAWSLSADLDNGPLTGRVYAREIEGGFGVGEQNLSESGTQKYGAISNWKFAKRYEISASADSQRLLDANSESNQALLEARRVGDKTALEVGYRWAESLDGSGISSRSELVNVAASYQLTSDLRIDAASEFSVVSQDASAIFPARNTLGAEWRLTDDSALYLIQEKTMGGTETQNTQLGLRTSMWDGAELNLGVDQSIASGQDQISAVAGLTQRAKINDKLSVDFTLDKGHDFSRQTDFLGINELAATSAGSGGNNYDSGSFGWDWRDAGWAWSTQLEHRSADLDRSTSIRTGLLKTLQAGRSLIGSVEWFKNTNEVKFDEDTTLSLGYADRSSPNYNWLSRVDLVWSEISGTAAMDSREQKIVSNNHLNYTGWSSGQLSLVYSGKYVLTTIADQEYSGYTDLIGAQYRHSLGEQWDIGVQASALQSRNANNNKYSYGASIGYSPVRDTWLELGYNLSGYSDTDFDAAAWTKEGIYFSVRYKFDETSLRRLGEAAAVFNGKSSSGIAPDSGQIATAIAPQKTPQSEESTLSVTEALEITASEVVGSSIAEEVPADNCPTDMLVRVIQLATFFDLDSARSMVAAMGLTSGFIEKYVGANPSRPLYRVVVGPYSESKAELAESAAVFEELTGIKPWVKEKECSDLRRVN